MDLNDNQTLLFFNKVNTFLVIVGMPGYIKWSPWRQDGFFRIVYKYVQKFVSVCLAIFVILELASPFTQKNLSDKQKSDLFIGYSHFILSSYVYIMHYNKERVQDLIYKLCIELKEVYSNPEVERQMIKKSTLYVMAFIFNLSTALLSYAFFGITQVLRGGTFVTVITAWPDVTDSSIAAGIGRIVAYLVWWVFMTRVSAVFVLLMATTGCMAFQFRNLQSYFYSLDDIFAADDENALVEENLEQKYEMALKVGIRLHVDTLWCVSQCQGVFAVVYSAQITMNISVLALLMLQMMSPDRTPASVFSIVISTIALLTSSGVLMWNAGDITVEAARLPEAMYSSGWENCRNKSSYRVRKLLVLAMNQAQRPVVIQTFGVMDVSYQAFVTMVKTSYSAFSLLY